jgi:exodeoxyribonuclease V alpha subunit
MNRGGVGARSLNMELQSTLNPPGAQRVERFGWTFAAGDKVMQIHEQLRQGRLQRRCRLDRARRSGRRRVDCNVRWPGVMYEFGELDMLVLAYAATIHKSQESEYPAVVIPIPTPHYAMLQRNLLYTGITRG